MNLIQLSKDLIFPPHWIADQNEGILAFGGDLSTERLILAYENGIFPWYSEDEPIVWHSPSERFVLFPHDLKISKSMRKVIREQKFTYTENKDFEQVIYNCKITSRKGQIGTWITDEMEQAYINLYKIGMAKSIEVWQKDELVGGLYGVDLGNVFCGESMFAKVSNASKFGFITFVKKYEEKYDLIDCQSHTHHLESLGATHILREDFLGFLKK